MKKLKNSNRLSFQRKNFLDLLQKISKDRNKTVYLRREYSPRTWLEDKCSKDKMVPNQTNFISEYYTQTKSKYSKFIISFHFK